MVLLRVDSVVKNFFLKRSCIAISGKNHAGKVAVQLSFVHCSGSGHFGKWPSKITFSENVILIFFLKFFSNEKTGSIFVSSSFRAEEPRLNSDLSSTGIRIEPTPD